MAGGRPAWDDPARTLTRLWAGATGSGRDRGRAHGNGAGFPSLTPPPAALRKWCPGFGRPWDRSLQPGNQEEKQLLPEKERPGEPLECGTPCGVARPALC